jgi:hypothetical protein
VAALVASFGVGDDCCSNSLWFIFFSRISFEKYEVEMVLAQRLLRF